MSKRLSGLLAPTPRDGRRGTSVLTPPLQSVISKMLQGCRCDFLIMRSLRAVMTVFCLFLRGSGHLLHYAQSGLQLIRSYYLTCVLRLQEPERPRECPYRPRLSRAIDLCFFRLHSTCNVLPETPLKYFIVVVKVNGEVHLRTGHEGPEED